MPKDLDGRVGLSSKNLSELKLIKESTGGISITWLVARAVEYAIKNPAIVWGFKFIEEANND